MTYAKGSNISASDLNGFIGANNVSTAYASAAAATGKVAALLGVGYGDRGYGQTTPALAPVSIGDPISTTQWVNLRVALAKIAAFQGVDPGSIPPASEFDVGSPIKAEVFATTPYDFPYVISSLDSNRLVAPVGSLSLVANVKSSIRGASWGTNGTPNIVAEFTASFASEDATRYFFNTGGTLNFALGHGDTSTPQNANWTSILNALGTISFGAKTTARTGTGGATNAIGYYNLTTAAQTIFSGTIGTGAYSANTINVTALAENVTGVNGGNGSRIRIRVTLGDAHANSFSDIVGPGTSIALGYRKAIDWDITGIQAPTYTFTVAF